MLIWVFLYVLVTAEVSEASGKCLKTDFVGKLES